MLTQWDIAQMQQYAFQMGKGKASKGKGKY